MNALLDTIAALPLDDVSARGALLLALAGGWLAAFFFAVRLVQAGGLRERLRARLDDARVARADAEARAARLREVEDHLDAEREARAREAQERVRLVTQLGERERALADMKQRMERDFQAAAAQMLNQAHESFLQRANETFERHAQAQAGEADKRAKAMNEMVKPISETLTRYEQGLTEMRRQQAESYGQLTSRIGELAKSANDVRAEAHKLASALRAGSKTRGAWGEQALKNVVELAGLSAYCDFEEQAHLDDGEARKRPDMVVRLPGGRFLAVDAKVSLGAYLDAVEAEDDATRAAHIARHGNQIWEHVKSLSAKDYAKAQRDALDFVVMFLPGDHFLAAAVEARPSIFQEAFDRKVLIATPTTLIAIFKSVAYGWRQEKAAENAFKVADMAKDLYESLRNMGGLISDVGKSLEGSVKKYNQLVGNVEARVMPRARRFSELELPGTEEAISALEPIEADVREPREGKDLYLEDRTDDDGSGKEQSAA